MKKYVVIGSILMLLGTFVVLAQDAILLRNSVPWWSMSGKNLHGVTDARLVLGDVTQKVRESGSATTATSAEGLITVTATQPWMSNIVWASINVGTNFGANATAQIAGLASNSVTFLVLTSGVAVASTSGTVFYAIEQ